MGTICVWNVMERLPRLRTRRTLSAHTEAVTALLVCAPQTLLGDIATASSSLLFVWSINGQILAVVNSIDSSSVEHIPNIILSIAFSTVCKQSSCQVETVIVCVMGNSLAVFPGFCFTALRDNCTMLLLDTEVLY
uniref:Uncharacterized protein n=1 Tax=Parascaris equorum TaxID=6256 RepID=A0A914SE65_PAREQ